MQITLIHNELTNRLNPHYIIRNRIREALSRHNFTAIVIFPTMQLLKLIQEELLQDPERPGIGGMRFLLFEGLIREIGEWFGTVERPPSSQARDILLTRCFRQLSEEGHLPRLGSVPLTPGYRRAILEGFSEWQRSVLTPEGFQQWAEGQGPREREWSLLYREYHTQLIRQGLHDESRLLETLKSRTGGRLLGQLWFYGFTDFTRLEAEWIVTLTQWFNCEIFVDPTSEPCGRELVRRYLWERFPQTLLGQADFPSSSPASPGNNALETLQECFWRGEPEPLPLATGDRSLQVLQTAGGVRQMTAIAREILWLLQETTVLRQWDDLLILTPSPRNWLKTATPVFAEYHLPLPPIPAMIREFSGVNRFWQSLCAAAADWPWTEMEVLLRQYYAGPGVETGDRLLPAIGERYGALSGRERWLRVVRGSGFTAYFGELGFDLEPLRWGIAWLERIPRRGAIPEFLRIVREWSEWVLAGEEPLAVLDLPAELLRRHLDDCRAVARLRQVTVELIELMHNDPFWAVEVSVGTFRQFFQDYLFNLELEPATVPAGTIRVLTPGEARGLKARVVFVTGLEEGVFPRPYSHDWKLSSTSRRDLRNAGYELESGESHTLKEKLAFNWALQSATERLYLICRRQDEDGQPVNPSVFLETVFRWFPEMVERSKAYSLAPQLPPGFQECFSRVEKRSFWAYCLSASPEQLHEPDWLACQAYIPAYRPMGVQIRDWYRRVSGPVFYTRPTTSRELGKIFHPGHTYAITSIEDYQTCPYRFFLKSLLQVRCLRQPQAYPTGPELGSLYHQILEDFVSNYRGKTFRPGDFLTYQQELGECFVSFFREWEERAANELSKLMLWLEENEIRRKLERWLEAEMEWVGETGERFMISHLELAFGLTRGDFDPASLTDPFVIPQGQSLEGTETEEVRLWGKVDRVDRDRQGNFIVYDYKSGKGPGVKKVLEGESLQLPVYILALEQLLFGPGKAAGGCYIGLRAPSRKDSGLWRSGQWQNALKSVDAKGRLEETAWQEWLEGVTRRIRSHVCGIRSGVFPRNPEACDRRVYSCDYKAVCRYRGEGQV